MLAFLSFAAQFQQDRPEHPDAQVELRLAATEALHFLLQHMGLAGIESAAAIFTRPVRREPAAVAHALEP